MKPATENWRRGSVLAAGISALLLAGCMDKLEKQGQKTGSIIGKKTQDVKEFDPKANQVVSDSKVRLEPGPLYAMGAYRPIIEQLMKGQIKQALDFFYVEHERFPKDHAEFMEKVIKPNQIQLPVLPEGYQYAYDVENHKLEVVKPLGDGKDAAKNEGQAAAKK